MHPIPTVFLAAARLHARPGRSGGFSQKQSDTRHNSQDVWLAKRTRSQKRSCPILIFREALRSSSLILRWPHKAACLASSSPRQITLMVSLPLLVVADSSIGTRPGLAMAGTPVPLNGSQPSGPKRSASAQGVAPTGSPSVARKPDTNGCVGAHVCVCACIGWADVLRAPPGLSSTLTDKPNRTRDNTLAPGYRFTLFILH